MITPQYLAQQLSGGGKVSHSGGTYRMQCVLPGNHKHADRNPSFEIWTAEDGKTAFACKAGCAWQEVYAELRRRGLDPYERSELTKASDLWQTILPVPSGAPSPPPEHFKFGRPSESYEYRDPQGRILFIANRFDLLSGEKVFQPLTFCSDGNGRRDWRWKGLEEPRPVFNQDELFRRPGCKVIVCEGEKAALAASELFPDCVTTTSPNGCKSASKADWSPLFGRDVIIWPDADEPGEKYSKSVEKILNGNVKSLKRVSQQSIEEQASCQLSDIADGFDAADALAYGINPALIRFDALEPKTIEPLVPTGKAEFLSQDFIAADFSKQNENKWRYVHRRNTWLYYDGARWTEDDKLRIFDEGRKVCRSWAVRANSAAERRQISSAGTVAAVIKFASASDEHAATLEMFDADVWLLNTPDGVVDLRSGLISEHDPDLLLSKITGITPKEMATPVYDEFMKWAQPDPEVREYLERREGYALTGDVSEQALFFDYGTGGNGKGVASRMRLEIMNTYAITAPIELLTENPTDKHPTELARLHKARSVTLSETQSGRRFNENRVKMMTGSDKITARFMRQDFFEYFPEFKLFILGNHMPALRNVDEAMRRRLQVVHWGATVAEDMKDTRLIEKLRPEFPGILWRWIRGCLDWQREGLRPPQAVTGHTEEYLKGEDKLGQWLEECTIRDANLYASKGDLFSSWSAWCEAQGETAGTMIKLTKALRSRGFDECTYGNQRSFVGLEVIRKPPISRYASPDINKGGNS